MTFLAVLLLGACAVPVLYFSMRGTGAMLAIFSLEFAGYYAAPVLMLHRVQIGDFPARDLPPQTVFKALELSLASFILTCLGYYLIPKSSTLIPRIKCAWSNPGIIRMAAVAMCGTGMAASYALLLLRGASGPSQFVAVPAELLMYGVALLFTLQLMHRLNPLYLIALWGIFIPARMALGLAAGETAAVLSVGLTLLLLYCELRGRMWWSAMIIGAFSVIVLRPLMTPFRTLTRGSGVESDAGAAERLIVFGRIARGATEGRYGDFDHLEQFAARRLCVICTFADVVRQTPRIVPYWNGATYYPILLKPIPRLLWPDKPLDISGQDFGHRYGYLDRSNYETSYNLPQTVELYANFGTIGVLIGSLLFGFLYRFIELMFFHPNSGIGAVAIGAVALTNLLAIESGISLAIGGLILAMIAVFPVALVVDLTDLWSESRRWISAA